MITYKQNGGEQDDAYDFGSSILQHYMQRQQEIQQQQEQQQQEAVPDNPEETPVPDNSSVPDSSDDMAIPDSEWFARKAFELNGDTQMQDELNEVKAQMAAMQSNYEALLAGQFQYDLGDDDEDEDDYTVPSYPSRSTLLSQQIADRESSGGDYQAYNPAGGGSGAVGKYQFRWNLWANDINRVTGVTSKEEFMTNPGAQESFYKWYEQNELLPAAERVSRYNTQGYTRDQLAKLVHYRGEQGAIDYLTGRLSDQPESYNMPISKYLRQHGGDVPVAEYPAEKYHGLNNEFLDQLLIKNNGYNQYRGLDSGKPVHLYDELGASTVLLGPDDLATLYGNVYEHR